MKLQKHALALAVATASVGLAGQAQAGTVSATFNTYAAEAINAGSIGAVANPAMAYQPGNVIAAGTTFTVYLRLSGGAKFASDFNATNIGATFGDGTNTASLDEITLSNDNTVAALQFTNGGTAITTSGVLNIPTATATGTIDLSGASALANAGGEISGTFSFANGGASSPVTVPSSPLDTATGTVAASEFAIQTHVVASSAFAGDSVIGGTNETARIDVGATPPLTQVTNTLSGVQTVDFGAVYLTETAGTQLNAAGADFTVTDLNNVSFDLQGNFLTANEAFALNTGAACGGTEITTGAVNSDGSRVSFTNVAASNFTVGTPVYICADVSTNTGSNAAAIPATEPTVNPVNLLMSSTVVNNNGSGTLYNLTTNGTTISLINYVPAADAPYQTYVRVANKGSISADITATLTDGSGSVLGQGVIVSGLSAGGSRTVDPSAIESALGVSLQAGVRPTLTLSAPLVSGDLKAQAYLADPNGGFTNMSADK